MNFALEKRGGAKRLSITLRPRAWCLRVEFFSFFIFRFLVYIYNLYRMAVREKAWCNAA